MGQAVTTYLTETRGGVDETVAVGYDARRRSEPKLRVYVESTGPSLLDEGNGLVEPLVG